MNIRAISEVISDLGEGPIWSADTSSVTWTDITQNTFHTADIDTGKTLSFGVPSMVGAIAHSKEGGYIAATQKGFARIGVDGKYSPLHSFLPDDMRMNDGKVDPSGRFWAGSMALSFEKGRGSLYVLEKDNSLDFIAAFKNDALTFVAGSSWPKDENLLVDYINNTSAKVKFIIAPHNIKEDQIQQLKNTISKKVVLFSEKETNNLAEFDVFIIDTIGILTKIYSYADIAYVGGGFGNPGVHNILEPATFGVPVVIGPNYSHFAEATALVNMGGCISISNEDELADAFSNLVANEDVRHEKGHICTTFVKMNQGATAVIMKKI
jgi:hypothetical protein